MAQPYVIWEQQFYFYNTFNESKVLYNFQSSDTFTEKNTSHWLKKKNFTTSKFGYIHNFISFSIITKIWGKQIYITTSMTSILTKNLHMWSNFNSIFTHLDLLQDQSLVNPSPLKNTSFSCKISSMFGSKLKSIWTWNK